MDYIIRDIQCRNIEECKTPNPMSASDISQAEAYAQKISQRVDGFFKEKLRSSSTKVIGVGSVLGHGISAMLGKNAFNLDEIGEVVRGLEGKTDADLGGGPYAFCEVSNTVFVQGLMQGLGIQRMEIVNINNTEGVLVYQPFWGNL